jgi:hypothetical protein
MKLKKNGEKNSFFLFYAIHVSLFKTCRKCIAIPEDCFGVRVVSLIILMGSNSVPDDLHGKKVSLTIVFGWCGVTDNPDG